MQITPAKTSSNFTSLFRLSSYTDCYGRDRYTQNTTAKRDDLDYDECARLMKRRFAKFDKINVMPMNGSDGTESYLLAHSILKVFGEKEAKKKVFPIIVSDVDPFIINKFGKKGVVALEPEDIKAFGDKFDKYFEEISMDELPKIVNGYSSSAKAFKLTPYFRSLFEFRIQDFQKRIGKVEDKGNTVILIRNCLAQAFGYVESMLLTAKIGDNLKGASMFVIGGYDRANMKRFVPDMQALLNFKEVGMNIFSKKANTPLGFFERVFKKWL